ncbi:MAG: TatD family hydrolase, partial [Verrucomicrobiae bacterium]|nr:TatD family hydrolase [Verrucomicrobiae bacterium]
MSIPYLDAHLHLQDDRLGPHLDGIVTELRRWGIGRWVVAGTRESDWETVAQLAERYPEVVPCYGLHPWFVADRSEDWEATL